LGQVCRSFALLPFGLSVRNLRTGWASVSKDWIQVSKPLPSQPFGLRYRSLALNQALGLLMSSGAALSPRRATYCSFASPKESRQRKGEPKSGWLLGSDANFAAVRSTAPCGRACGSANLDSCILNPMDNAACLVIVDPAMELGRCRRAAPKATKLHSTPVGSRLAARFTLGLITRGSAWGARRISFMKSPNSCPSFELVFARRGHHE
jgi:hypothetical protein